MKISVVTAVWNRESTIGDTLNSVLEQDYQQVEYIIQDGGSTDNTLKIIQDTAPNALLVSETDGGIYDAINRGIRRSTGDVIGLMHSDDFYAHKHVLTKVVDKFKKTDADGVYADLDYVSSKNIDHTIRQWKSGNYMTAKLASGWMPPHPTLFLKRSVFEKYGLYDTNFHIAADYDAMLRYLCNGVTLAYLPEVTIKMRTGGASNESLKKVLRKSHEDYMALRRNHIGGIRTLLLKNLTKVKQFTNQQKTNNRIN